MPNEWSRPDKNDDFSLRAEFRDEQEVWTSTRSAGVKIKPIESVGSLHPPRLTALLSMEPGSQYQLHHHSGAELLVLDGSLDVDQNTTAHPAQQTCPTGSYLRFPVNSGLAPSSKNGSTVFMKLGQISSEDKESRIIDCQRNDDWLPGPVDGTEVLALHLHQTKCVMLIRWFDTAYFKPKLDPQGEELFVVSGTLFDDRDSYREGTWIRNPIPAWQSWGGYKGTVVYYKNGHFP